MAVVVESPDEVVISQPWLPSWGVVVLHQLLLWLFLGWLLWRVPKYFALFTDMDVELPEAVELIFNLTDLLRRFWFGIPILLIVTGAGVYVIDGLLVASRQWSLRFTWLLTLFAGTIGIWVGTTVTLLMTVNQLLEELN